MSPSYFTRNLLKLSPFVVRSAHRRPLVGLAANRHHLHPPGGHVVHGPALSRRHHRPRRTIRARQPPRLARSPAPLRPSLGHLGPGAPALQGYPRARPLTAPPRAPRETAARPSPPAPCFYGYQHVEKSAKIHCFSVISKLFPALPWTSLPRGRGQGADLSFSLTSRKFPAHKDAREHAPPVRSPRGGTRFRASAMEMPGGTMD